MKVKLPVVTKNEIIDGRRVFESGEREFELDLSLGSEVPCACRKRNVCRLFFKTSKTQIGKYSRHSFKNKSSVLPV